MLLRKLFEYIFHRENSIIHTPFWFVMGAQICNTVELCSIPGLGRSPGEGNGNPLQDSCLENPMDREAWRATVLGVTKVGHDWETNTLPFICLLIHIHTYFKDCLLLRKLFEYIFHRENSQTSQTSFCSFYLL